MHLWEFCGRLEWRADRRGHNRKGESPVDQKVRPPIRFSLENPRRYSAIRRRGSGRPEASAMTANTWNRRSGAGLYHPILDKPNHPFLPKYPAPASSVEF